VAHALAEKYPKSEAGFRALEWVVNFEQRELAIGKVAPEIEGEDADGVPFKLADYRGKVVVLDFWGHW
jgi:cytochrome oxidase Cu insertion factor (SCO1/SenC/PrrC family)